MSRKPDADTNESRKVGINHTRRSFVISGIVALGLLGGGTAALAASSSPPSTEYGASVSNNPAAQQALGTNAAGVQQQIERVGSAFQDQAQKALPTPQLPQDQRSVIYANQLKLANCMRADGYPTFPLPNPSFGDGKTPPLALGGPQGGDLDATTPAFIAAMNACSVGMAKVPSS